MSKEIPIYPLLIEESSNYAFTVRRMQKPLSFDKFRDTSNKFYNDLPEEIRDELHKSILRGTCMLSNEPELNAYMHDMGKMHNAKLRKAFDNLSDNFYKADCIDIIDYGCGQGLAIIALADHFREDFIHIGKEVRRIVLIEPSEMALKRAALHASALFPKAKLVTINKGFDDLVAEDIVSDAEVMTLHILSNVLDLAKTDLDPKGYFDLNRFADLISANLEGENQFVGIEPWFNYDITDEKFPRFWKRVGISKDFKLICNKGEFVAGKNWTCVIVCGEKNNLSLFQKLSKNYVEVGEMSEDAICVSQVGFYRGGCCHAEPVLKYGFVDKSGNKIILCEFSDAENFRNGLAFVENGYDEYAYWSKYHWGAINKQGEIVIPFIYESIKWADNGECIIASVEDRVDNYDRSGNLMAAEGRIIEYTSTDGEIVEPNSIAAFDAKIISNTYKNGVGKIIFDKPITKIGDEAFLYCDTLKNIRIPDSVSMVGDSAFLGCSGLTGITIPNSVVSIGNRAFFQEGNGNLGNIIIGNNVKKIGSYAFGYARIQSILLPDSLIEIGEGAFSSCDNLTSITIPNSITKIEDYTFDYCSSLVSIHLGDHVSSIGMCAFLNCASLSNIKIPSGVRNIGLEAFSGCTSLPIHDGLMYADTCLVKIVDHNRQTHRIKDGTRFICTCVDDTFYCENIYIPNSIESVSVHTFSCDKLRNFYGDKVSLDNRCLIIDGKLAAFASAGIKEYTIPNGVSIINENVFQYCSELRSVTIPNSVSSIETYNFYFCENLRAFYGKFISLDHRCIIVNKELIAFAPEGLTEYRIPNDVVTIGRGAFESKWGLKTIIISYGVISIGSSAFSGCISLADIFIPDSVTSIGAWTFSCCHSLTSITIPSSVTVIKWHAFNNCSQLKSVYCMATIPPVVIPAAEESLYCNTGCIFQSTPLDAIYVPMESVMLYKNADGWREYADRIFGIEENSTLQYTSTDENVVVPHSIKAFDAKIISNTYKNGVGKIIFDKPITKIGSWAFSDCSSLTSITIPDSVTEIESWAFNGCCSLLGVYISDLSAWCRISFGFSANPLCNGANLYLNGTLVTELTIPSDITRIKSCAFAGCSSLISVIIPDGITLIEHSAFAHCNGLASITIPNSVVSIESYAFSHCGSLRAFYGKFTSVDNRCLIEEGVLRFFAPAGLTEYIIPESTTSIGVGVFGDCESLTSITIPDSVTSIGHRAFYGCSGLTTYYGKFASKDNRCLIEDGVLRFFAPAGISKYTMPDSITTIEAWAFENCSSLTSITIPNSVIKIENYAFYGCYGLTNVHMSDLSAWCKIDFEGDSANPLNYAHNLYLDGVLVTELTFLSDVTEIKSYAFQGCSSLTSVTIPDSVTSIGESAFRGCSSLTSATIPDSVTSIGEHAFAGCAFEHIVIPCLVDEIGENAFWGSNIKTLICYALTPPKIKITLPIMPFPEDVEWLSDDLYVVPEYMSGDMERYNEKCMGIEPIFRFDDGEYILTSDVQIYVPSQSVEAYKSARGWCEHADRIFAIEENMASNEIKEVTTANESTVEIINGMEVR